jgi:hypothetical protein
MWPQAECMPDTGNTRPAHPRAFCQGSVRFSV